MNAWESINGETPIDISSLKAAGVTNRRQLSIVEAENVADAIRKYLGGPVNRRTAKFNDTWSMKLHKEMFGRVWKWAGKPRQTELNLGVAASQITQQLYSLFADLAEWDAHWPDRIEQAVHLHYRAVVIHPFENGNGRWSRMLSNIWLRLHKQPIIEWPADLGETSSVRDEYLVCLKQADRGEIKPLIELHRRFVRPT